MKKVEFFVNISLQKKITIEVAEGEDAKFKARGMVYVEEMDAEEYRELLTSSRLDDVYVEEVTLEDKVQMAINDFDPFVLMPGHIDGAPYNEYKGLSNRIAAKIKQDMSKEEVVTIIVKELDFTFGMDFSRERCMRPAEKIHEFLIQQI